MEKNCNTAGFIKAELAGKLKNITRLLIFLNGDPAKKYSVLESTSFAALRRTNQGAPQRLGARDKERKK